MKAPAFAIHTRRLSRLDPLCMCKRYLSLPEKQYWNAATVGGCEKITVYDSISYRPITRLVNKFSATLEPSCSSKFGLCIRHRSLYNLSV